MLCPECKHNTLEPEYRERLDPSLSDHPLFRDAEPCIIREITMFRCTHCKAYYFACSGESAEQAYWRIIRDYAKD